MNIYEKISELNNTEGAFLCTVLDGNVRGQKAIVSDDNIDCADGADCQWIESHSAELQAIRESGICEIDGIRVYAEAIGNEKTMVVCGAGHVSMAIIDLAKMTGFHVIVIDDRLKFAENAIREGADEVICKNFEEALAKIPGGRDYYFVVVTRGHRYDRECLRSIADKPHAYIGMMGSKRRTIMVKKELAAEGISGEIMESLHTPIGLKIGAETPEEIAVSIMAEIIEVKNTKKNYGFSKDILETLCDEKRDKTALATIIERRGSAPRGMGTKMLIMRDGGTVGTIGGGCIEGSVIQKGRRMLINGEEKTAIVNVDMSMESAEEEGMVCGGTVDVLLEVV